MGREVPGYSLRTFLHALRLQGVDLEPLLVGLSFTHQDVARSSFRASWEDCCVLYDRIRATVPALIIERAATDFGVTQPGLRLIAQRVIGIRPFYEVTFQASKALWPVLVMKRKKLGDGRFEWRIRVKDGLRGNLLLFEATGQILRVMPRQLGLDDAIVEQEISAHHAVYRIRLPASQALFARGVRASVKAVWTEIVAELSDYLALFDGGVPDDPALNTRRRDRAAARGRRSRSRRASDAP